MAKITDFKFELNGKKHVVHVNCKSDGSFSANLPEEVSNRLELKKTLAADTLLKLEKEFYGALDRYKKAAITQELLIAIKYKASGDFMDDKDGNCLFGQQDKYYLDINWNWDNTSALAFQYHVIIKETVDTVTKDYYTTLGKDMSWMEKEHETIDDNKYYKAHEFHDRNEYKFIPFSQQAIKTLKAAHEKLRQVSEALFHFIEQDEEQIMLTLTKNKLLTN